MFYPSDLLKKRGKFGFIWLASTKTKKLHRRQICSVDVVEASEDIMDVINTHYMAGISRKVYFSLYLSSHLVSGLVYIADMQTRFLLEDLKAIVLKLHDSKKTTIDLNMTLSKAKVTLKQLDMDDVPLDFGCFNPSPEPSHHAPPYNQYFLITTPKSSEASSPDLGKSIFEVPQEEENSFHLARKEDITLTDALPFEIEDPIPELEEIVDLFAPPLAFIPPSIEPESVQPFDRDEIPFQHDTKKSIFLTPEVADEELPAEQLRDTSLIPELPPEQIAGNELSDGFVLPPTVPDCRKRKRKHHLLVDAATSLTVEQIKKNISSANTNLTMPLVIPSTQEAAKSLMTRLGYGFLAPQPILERLKRLKTLPQLEEENVSREERDGFTSPLERRMSVSESAEQQRDGTKEPSVSAFLKSSSSRTLEASVSAIARPEENESSQCLQEVDSEISRSAPDIETQISESRFSTSFDTAGLLPEMDTQQCELITEERYLSNRVAEKRVRKECFVSPEPSPPSSPPPLHMIRNEAFELIEETVAASIIPNVTTFSAMLKNTDATRKRVASLFNLLLCFHAEGKIILQQPVAGSEIFIELQS